MEWYQKVTIPAGTKEKTVVTLRNIEGNVTLDLAKTAKDLTQESLFTQGADLEYTIRPAVGKYLSAGLFYTYGYGTDRISRDRSYFDEG